MMVETTNQSTKSMFEEGDYGHGYIKCRACKAIILEKNYHQHTKSKTHQKGVERGEEKKKLNIHTNDEGKRVIICECGKTITYKNNAKHRMTLKHKRWEYSMLIKDINKDNESKLDMPDIHKDVNDDVAIDSICKYCGHTSPYGSDESRQHVDRCGRTLEQKQLEYIELIKDINKNSEHQLAV
jgi:hypothetical protein